VRTADGALSCTTSGADGSASPTVTVRVLTMGLGELGRSLRPISTDANERPRLPALGLLSVTENCSSCSASSSLKIGTVKVWTIWPGAKMMSRSMPA
jgi:hypothetical protein